VSDAAELWTSVDDLLVRSLVDEDDALRQARAASHDAGLPAIEVTANQGALLSLFVRMVGGRRVLELGTLGGYSTIWLARGVGPAGRVVTLELDPKHARVARENLDRAGLGDVVEILLGPAADSLDSLVATDTEPFDLVFLDADKQNNARYLAAALDLTRPGSVIVVDNVVRGGALATVEGDDDDRVRGTRDLLTLVHDEPRLTATALQTVGAKGWDGFLLALVN
jgi:predicted O-methyltransferase YrrM